MRRTIFILSVLAILGAAAMPAVAAGGTAALFQSYGFGPDGEEVLTVDLRPINYYDAKGDLQTIDLEVHPVESGFVNEANTLKSSFRPTYTEGWSVDLDGRVVEFAPLSVGRRTEDGHMEWMAPEPGVEGQLGGEPGVLLYEGTYRGISDEFVIRRGELDHVTVLDTLESLPPGTGPVEFAYRMTLPEGLTARLHPLTIEETETNGLISMPFISLETGEGVVEAVIPTPFFWDSGDRIRMAAGDLGWEKLTETEGIVTVRASDAILETMTFPVRIDPQVWQTMGPANMVTGAAWGDFIDQNTLAHYSVRFNGNWMQVGAVEANFGPPIGVQTIKRCAATVVFDLSQVPGHVTDAWIDYTVLLDTYGGLEDVVLNDHKTDALNPDINTIVFGNNISDARNIGDYLSDLLPPGYLPDFTKDKRYRKAYHGPQTFDTFGANEEYKLVGRALHDIHKSMRGEVKTPSAIPLAPGLFAVSIYDTSEYSASLGLRLITIELRFRTNE